MDELKQLIIKQNNLLAEQNEILLTATQAIHGQLEYNSDFVNKIESFFEQQNLLTN